jgi:hypothetical protein
LDEGLISPLRSKLRHAAAAGSLELIKYHFTAHPDDASWAMGFTFTGFLQSDSAAGLAWFVETCKLKDRIVHDAFLNCLRMKDALLFKPAPLIFLLKSKWFRVQYHHIFVFALTGDLDIVKHAHDIREAEPEWPNLLFSKFMQGIYKRNPEVARWLLRQNYFKGSMYEPSEMAVAARAAGDEAFVEELCQHWPDLRTYIAS